MSPFPTLLALMLIITSAFAELPEPEIKEGTWHIPLRHWAHLSPVLEGTGGFDFLCEVKALGDDVPMDQEPPLRFKTGTLKVVEMLRGDTKKFPSLKTLTTLRVQGCEGLQIGDLVIVFVDGEPYEGGYVIDFHRGTNCTIGHRLARKTDFALEHDFDKRREVDSELIRLVKNGRTHVSEATADDLRTLSIMDPDGVREGLIREIERGRLIRKQAREEHDSAGEPATAVNSKAEGDEEPRLETNERPR